MKKVNKYRVANFSRRQNSKVKIRLFGCIALAFILLSGSMFVIHSSAKGEHTYSKCYTSVKVQNGDSLWNIAKKYKTPASSDIQENIDEIKRINHIQGDEIKAGDYLTVPYYLADSE